MKTRSHNTDTLPSVIRIGVIGHRVLSNPESVTSSALALFDKLRTRLNSESPSSHIQFVIFSSLAEGADRVLSRAAMTSFTSSSESRASLVALLPMETERFKKRFTGEQSGREFDDLLRQCGSQHILPSVESDETA